MPALVGAMAALAVDSLKAIVFRFFQKRDQKLAQRRVDFENLRDVILETRDLATRYWQDPGNMPDQKARQASIIGRLTYVAKVQSHIFANDMCASCIVGRALKDFHEACSGADFGSANRAASPERCSDIEISAYTFVHSCQTNLERLH